MSLTLIIIAQRNIVLTSDVYSHSSAMFFVLYIDLWDSGSRSAPGSQEKTHIIPLLPSNVAVRISNNQSSHVGLVVAYGAKQHLPPPSYPSSSHRSQPQSTHHPQSSHAASLPDPPNGGLFYVVYSGHYVRRALVGNFNSDVLSQGSIENE